MSLVQLTRTISKKQLSWRNDPRIHAFTRQNGILSDAEHAGWLERIHKDPSILMFGIKDNNDEIGTCGLTSISLIHGTAEFSLLIDPDKHQKGYGKDALKQLLRYGFDHLRLNLIFGETFVGNHAIKMFLNLGMKKEGQLRSRYFKNGKHIDSIMVSITKEEAEKEAWWEV